MPILHLSAVGPRSFNVETRIFINLKPYVLVAMMKYNVPQKSLILL